MFNTITSAATAALNAAVPYLPYAAAFAGGAMVTTGIVYGPGAVRSGLSKLRAQRSEQALPAPEAAEPVAA